MKTEQDIRDKVDLVHEDIAGLNFIRAPEGLVFRKHFRQGLRSRIMEVLDAGDVRKEAEGEVRDGIRRFPRARPLKMLRIFTSRFHSLSQALAEARRYAVIESYLGSGHIAASSEFVVEYIRSGKRHILLCGLQEYVAGEILDPWQFAYPDHFMTLCRNVQVLGADKGGISPAKLAGRVRASTEDFISRLKQMAMNAGCIPDLSGIGNLIMTCEGDVKLVDINNVSRFSFDDAVTTDDKGYPVCDKSIEVIAILEREILGRSIDMDEPVYRILMDPDRRETVRLLEERFYAISGDGHPKRQKK